MESAEESIVCQYRIYLDFPKREMLCKLFGLHDVEPSPSMHRRRLVQQIICIQMEKLTPSTFRFTGRAPGTHLPSSQHIRVNISRFILEGQLLVQLRSRYRSIGTSNRSRKTAKNCGIPRDLHTRGSPRCAGDEMKMNFSFNSWKKMRS